MQVSYSGGFKGTANTVAELESAALDQGWVAEAYGYDGPSLMGYLAAKTSTVWIASGILPIYTRTPTLIAMTATDIDALSDRRFGSALPSRPRCVGPSGDRGLARREVRRPQPHP